jgi:F0F1-type ATP synthase assembly protein I
MIGRNNAMSTKAKMEALEKLVEVAHRYGELEAHLKMNDIDSLDMQEQTKEDIAKDDAKRTSLSNDFVTELLAGMGQNQQAMGGEQQQGQM